MNFIKTLTIDGFYSNEVAKNIASVIFHLPTDDFEFGKQVKEFNLISEDIDELFTSFLKFNFIVDKESGIFRYPDRFIHFESFNSLNDWLFVVALEQSTFNIFTHVSGIETALEEHKFQYRNFFEWNLTTNHILNPGQGILFRPWLFHSFDNGLIQVFKLTEV